MGVKTGTEESEVRVKETAKNFFYRVRGRLSGGLPEGK